eukprot:7715139-Pyramimonas_sp.AAC.1
MGQMCSDCRAERRSALWVYRPVLSARTNIPIIMPRMRTDSGNSCTVVGTSYEFYGNAQDDSAHAY